jgi:hypothetical protein
MNLLSLINPSLANVFLVPYCQIMAQSGLKNLSHNFHAIYVIDFFILYLYLYVKHSMR